MLWVPKRTISLKLMGKKLYIIYAQFCVYLDPGPLVEPLKPLKTFNLVAIL